MQDRIETTVDLAASIEVGLGKILGSGSDLRNVRSTPYSDVDIQQVSDLLRKVNKVWSRIPRLYIVLRTIDRLDVIDSFIREGRTDVLFPFSPTSLPIELDPSTRAKFVDAQSCVLTKVSDLEIGEHGKHIHFERGESPPYETLGILGSGGYAQVDKVWSSLSHKEYARKQFRRTRNERAAISFERELEILKKLRHPHMVELVASYTDSRFLALILSPVAECNLAQYYGIAFGSTDKLSLLRSFYGCLSQALEYLHDSRIRHKDIKPQNVLIKSSNVLLTDFGISRDCEDASGTTTTGETIKTPRYCAPEVASGEPRNYFL